MYESHTLRRNPQTLQNITLGYFVETHLCNLCVILRSRVLVGVSYILIIKDIGRRLPLELQCSFCQGQQGEVNQYVGGNNKKPVFDEDNSDRYGRKNAYIFSLSSVSWTDYIYKVPLRDVGDVKSRGHCNAKKEAEVTHVSICFHL